MPSPKKPTIHIMNPVKRVEQTVLDSRQLGPCDAYFKLAHKTGVNTFKVTTSTPGESSTHREGRFKLSAGAGDSHLHTFGVRRRPNGATALTGEVPRATALPRGTVVMWHSKLAGPATMTVTGTGDNKSFTNKKMNHHEGFSHVFLETGTFRYHNGKGGTKRKWGEVKVKKAPEPKYLTKGEPIEPVLVECKADGFHPDKVEIVVGQAVGWIVFVNGTSIIGEA